MAGMSEILGAVSKTLTELGPLVTLKVLPYEAAKEIVLAVIRRARLGNAVEDAFEKMTAPPPPPPQTPANHPGVMSAQAKGQADVAIANIEAQSDERIEQQKATNAQHLESMRQSAENQRKQMGEQMESFRLHMQEQFDAAVKIIVAQIGAKSAVDQSVIAAADSKFLQGENGNLAPGPAQPQQQPAPQLPAPPPQAQAPQPMPPQGMGP